MAPSNSAKALQQNRQRPRAPKRVVPAVPLTFEQRRQKQLAARVQPVEETAPPPAPAVTAEAVPSSPQVDDNPATEADGAPEAGPAESVAEVTESTTSSELVATPLTEDEAAQRSPTQSLHETDEGQEAPRSTSSEAASSGSRSTYQIPPPFVPATPNAPPTVSSETVKFPQQRNMNGQSTVHHGHPSAGSILFTPGPESSNSSPAPPPAAANLPPYPYQQHQQLRLGAGRPPHLMNGVSPVSNGFPPLGPPPPAYYVYQDSNMSAAADNYARRQLFGYPPDGYSPSNTPLGMEGHRFNGYDPPTPHSFHGSQASAPSEQENGVTFQNQYSAAAVSIGSNGHGDGPHLNNQQRPKVHGSAQNSLPPQPPNQLPLPVDTLDGLVNYVYHQFNNAEFADYMVELRSTDDRFPVQQVHGHGLMFARSPALKILMSALKHEGKHENHGTRILIQTDDRFIRPDAFWMAMHRLYGGALLDMETFGPVNVFSSPQHAPLPVSLPGTSTDRLEMALAYAAAGKILQMPPVIIRGVEIACSLVDWATVEKALDFALDGGLDAQWTQESAHKQPESPSTYGPSVNSLIYKALQFIIFNFPVNFELDSTVEENAHNARLPAIPQDRPNAPDRRMPQFGDFSGQESPSSTTPTSTNSTLSKVLLNLPFHLLKYVLEFRRLGNVEPWGNVSLRRRALDTIVAEREKRRVKVYNSRHVSNAERQKNFASWQPVGYEEFVELRAAGDGDQPSPVLVRKWVDYVLPAHQT